MDNTLLRQAMRRQRRQLAATERTLLSNRLSLQLLQQAFMQSSQTIACYWPFAGEVDTHALILALWAQAKTCYLPRLDSTTKRLQFAEYTAHTPLQNNCYGIAEPTQASKLATIADLDIILLPVVAFDVQGHRLGTGGGYYDRTLAIFNTQARPTNPLLIGLAYEFQQVAYLQTQPWDIRLDGIMTEQQFYLSSEAI